MVISPTAVLLCDRSPAPATLSTAPRRHPARRSKRMAFQRCVESPLTFSYKCLCQNLPSLTWSLARKL